MLRTPHRHFGAKLFRFGLDARISLMRGIDLITEAVGCTLGPRGRTVLLPPEPGQNHLRITKDGFTVARAALPLKDPFAQLGAALAAHACERVNSLCGDGTTTTMILIQAVTYEGLRRVAGGVDPFSLRRGLAESERAIQEWLDSRTLPGDSWIGRVATVAAGGDEKLGKLVTDALERVGRFGSASVETAHREEMSVEYWEGYRWEGGPLMPEFLQGGVGGSREIVEPLVLLTTQSISSMAPLERFIEFARSRNRPLLLVAERLEASVISALLATNGPVAVRPPGMGSAGLRELNDLAALTGAVVIDPSLGLELENSDISVLGEAGRAFLFPRHATLTRPPSKNLQGLSARLAKLRADLPRAPTKFERRALERRIGRLTGGVALLRVGGHTPTVSAELRDRAEDALHAASSAREKGILPGGAGALLCAGRALKDPSGNFEAKCGADILRIALRAPAERLAYNSGLPAKYLAAKLMEAPEGKTFDVRTGAIVDALGEGIVDSAHVVKMALKEAVDIAGLILSAELAIVDVPYDDGRPVYPSMKDIAKIGDQISGVTGL